MNENEVGEIQDEVAERLAAQASKDEETGLVRLELEDGYVFYLSPLGNGAFLAFSQLAELEEPVDGAVLRTLLAANLFGAGTGFGHFALEDTTGAVVWQARLTGTAAELAAQIAAAADLCRQWTARIEELVANADVTDEFGGEEVQDADLIRV